MAKNNGARPREPSAVLHKEVRPTVYQPGAETSALAHGR